MDEAPPRAYARVVLAWAVLLAFTLWSLGFLVMVSMDWEFEVCLDPEGGAVCPGSDRPALVKGALWSLWAGLGVTSTAGVVFAHRALGRPEVRRWATTTLSLAAAMLVTAYVLGAFYSD